jgi:hypothetical protein
MQRGQPAHIVSLLCLLRYNALMHFMGLSNCNFLILLCVARTFTAVSTSAASASLTCVMTSPVAGSTLGNLHDIHPIHNSKCRHTQRSAYKQCSKKCPIWNMKVVLHRVKLTPVSKPYVLPLSASTNSPAQDNYTAALHAPQHCNTYNAHADRMQPIII